MKAITKYQANDGTEFSNEADCAAYEAFEARVIAVSSLLPPQPEDDGCRFANGHGYIQHNTETLARVKRQLVSLANESSPHKWFQQTADDPTVHPSWAGRLISEMDSRALRSAWHRIECIDSQNREFGQPYYANHPEEAELVEVTNVGRRS